MNDAAQKLYSPWQVSLATFLGSPMAGCHLLAFNFEKLGDSARAHRYLALGSLATIALFVAVLSTPKLPGHNVIPIAYTLGIQALANKTQGEAFKNHIPTGGQKFSTWKAAGIGLACLVALFAVIIILLMLLPEGTIHE